MTSSSSSYNNNSNSNGTEFRFKVSIDIEVVRYLREKETEEFKAFAMKETGTVSSEAVSTTISKDMKTITTITRVVPALDLPWMIRKTVLKGKAVEFMDSRQFDAHGASRRAPFTQKFQSLNNISSAAEVLGEVTFARHPEYPDTQKTLITVEGIASVAIPTLGKQIEKIIVQNLQKTYESLPKLIDGWNAMNLEPETLTYFPEPELIAIVEENENEEEINIENVQEIIVKDGTQDLLIITSPRRAAQRAAALRELASKRNNGRARRWVSLSANSTPNTTPWSSPLRKKKPLFEARERLLARNKKRRRKGLFYYCGGTAFAPIVIFLFIVLCTWLALLIGFLPDVSDDLTEEHSHLLRAAAITETDSDVTIEDAKWIGKKTKGNSNGNSNDSVRNEKTVKVKATVTTKKECVDSNQSCAMWACDGECEKNPSFMSESCPCACEAMTKMQINNPERIEFEQDAFSINIEWFDEKNNEIRHGSVTVHLDIKNAPKSAELVKETVRSGACSKHSYCGASKCAFTRVEKLYGLAQGKFSGLGKLGGKFGNRVEGEALSFSWERGVIGSIPGGGDDFLIATKAHKEWDTGFTPFGRITEEDMIIIDRLLALKTEPFTHPHYKTVMAMLKMPISFYLSK